MTKPTVSTEWASDSAALKADPSYTQQILGWTTNDGTETGTPVKPNLHHQNGWQYNVYTWLGWIEENTPDDVPVDLWKWDVGSYVDGTNADDGTNIMDSLSVVDSVPGDGEFLQWLRGDRGQLSDANAWVDFQAETYFGSAMYEFTDMLGRGVAISIVDANDVTWTIFNTNGSGLTITSTSTSLSGESTDATGSNRILTFKILSSCPDVSIRTDTAGVIAFPSNFLGFGTLTSANFDTKNPDGIRAVLYGNKDVDVLLGGKAEFPRPKKRWIFPAINSKVTQETSPFMYWRFVYEYGVRYQADFIFVATASGGFKTNTGLYAIDPGTSERVGLYAMSIARETYQISQQFYGPNDVVTLNKNFKIQSSLGMALEGGGQSMFLNYHEVQESNILIIEELD